MAKKSFFLPVFCLLSLHVLYYPLPESSFISLHQKPLMSELKIASLCAWLELPNHHIHTKESRTAPSWARLMDKNIKKWWCCEGANKNLLHTLIMSRFIMCFVVCNIFKCCSRLMHSSTFTAPPPVLRVPLGFKKCRLAHLDRYYYSIMSQLKTRCNRSAAPQSQMEVMWSSAQNLTARNDRRI